jgi:hypothetical protein
MSMKQFVVGGLAAAAVATTACSSEPAFEESPELATAANIEAQDEGWSYNGWEQLPAGWYGGDGNVYTWNYFVRSYGDSTRGGGSCVVYHRDGSSCSSDATCLSAAQAQFGASAWGYCSGGACWSRPGSQAAYCSLGPNRTPGQYHNPAASEYAPASHTGPAVLGCMTKTAGPNTACGGTNTSLYMRTVGGIASPW